MKKMKKVISALLVLCIIVTLLPNVTFAAHDSTGKPQDLTGGVYLALYTGDSFPGEPAEYGVSGYLNFNSSFEAISYGQFASSAEAILEPSILSDVVQGTSGVWGVFSTTGGSRYLLPTSGLVSGEAGDTHKPHDLQTEQKVIQAAIDNGKFTLAADTDINDYTIVWYVVKYQQSDSSWHIDGLITKKTTFSVNYYGNGNTSGGAPSGTSDLEDGASYTVLGNTGSLRKSVGSDTYIFNGWNTSADGTGTHYDAGDVITIDGANVNLYAEWYLQNRYTISVVTKLDDVERNVEDIHGEPLDMYVRLEGTEDYIPLEKTSAGTYVTTVTENGIYKVFAKSADGEYNESHGHQVAIYNQNGSTEMLNYSVSYALDGGQWQEGQDPGTAVYHANHEVTATDAVPVKDGYTFVGWVDQNGNAVAADGHVTDAILEKTVLTAQWQKNISVTVNITVDHTPEGGGINPDKDKDQVLFQLLQQVNGVNLPYSDSLLLDQTSTDWSYAYDETAGVTTYTYTFGDLPQSIYNASCTKSHYETVITHTGSSDTDQTIDIQLTYTPDSFDLEFVVVVNHTEQTRELMPVAVNVKAAYWDGAQWQTIPQQAGDSAPTTVMIGQDGTGAGYVPVWKYWPDDTAQAYVYRVEVTSFVMPDGSILPASGDLVTYRPEGAGLYTAVVSLEDGGTVPAYPEADKTALPGAIYDAAAANEQNGMPTVTVDITPFTVTFDAGDGKLSGEAVVVLEGQYQYPNLYNYIPEAEDTAVFFAGWYDAEGNPAVNQYGSYLTENVTYYARYSLPMTVEGAVSVAGTYLQEGETVNMHLSDRADEVMVVLQKIVNDNLVDVDSVIIPITYADSEADGIGSYRFENVPNDGTQYRIRILVHNYSSTYDNESDADVSYSETEYTAVLGDDTTAVVDARLEIAPDAYEQMMELDASQIAAEFRPTGALSEVLYRDLGDIHPYHVISQHTVAPYGAEIPLAANGLGSGSYSVWQYHTDGTLYEYQMNVTRLYGDVDGVFSEEGMPYNSDTAPFTIEYDPASRYSAVAGGQARVLKATLVPKEYEIIFDMGLSDGEEVQGMDQYLTDGQTGEDYYSYLHTWSYGDSIMAFPYREGYVFEGWTSSHDGVLVSDHGYITVGAELAENVVLTASWRKLEDNAYTVRHLELNTDIPLHGAVVVEGSSVTEVKAVDEVLQIDGYEYAGAKIGDRIYSLNEEAVMTVTSDPTQNVLTIYYLPDGSDGYTDQVESNLKLDKTAVLEDNGTYTVNLETYTMDNPVTTLIQQNTPLDIVLVLDQSGSIIQSGYLDELQAAVDNFVELIADHGRHNEVDHRIAIVGYAGNEDEPPTSTDTSQYPIAGGNTTNWVNTGVFDSNGDFHPYTVTGFNYTPYTGTVSKDGIYYTYSEGEYLLLSYHEQYRHLITAEEARLAVLDGQTVYGYVYDSSDIGSFVELTRNSSGLWLYGDKQLYSAKEFFTYHEDVWTHRKDMEPRQIHAYGTGSSFTCADGHDNLYTRTETTDANPELDVYYDALVPVSVGANGSGGTNPHVLEASTRLGSNGGTYVQYGIEMANKIFEANALPADSDRVRIMVMFTDGLPGIGTFDETVANEAIAQAYIAKNTHNAYSYTIGLYPSDGVNATDDESIYMNAVSSNYPDAQSMADIMHPATYVAAQDGAKLDDGNTYYVQSGGSYYEVKYGRVYTSGSWWRQYCWYYTVGSTNYRITTTTSPTVSGGAVSGTAIYTYQSAGYLDTPYSGYYATTDSEQDLKDYFAHIVEEITTKITKEIILHEDTILRDIMGQGLVLTPGTVITAYKVAGTYDADTDQILWSDTREQVAQVTVAEIPSDTLYSPETVTMRYTLEDGTAVTKENVPYLSVYNLAAANATDPDGADYHPHTVDITGYDFENWYISQEHPSGYKMAVEITRVEARDDVQWGRSTATNNDQSGLWLPADENGNRQLLLPFRQPTTIFVERAYVLDYAKEFTLSGWYFDSEENKTAQAIHVDCNIQDGMNWFDGTAPNTTNGMDSPYGNTAYGNVSVENGQVKYTPVTTSWGGYDQFYVFGNTWRKTVLAQDANENGNLWNKVTVIPANNVYYEDSFITTENSGVNGFSGFTFTGAWETVSSDADAGGNVEIPEHQEDTLYGDVHGWSDSLHDDEKFTDGSAHRTDTPGAAVEFTFTGTGVDVYTRTNSSSGAVIATLYEQQDGGWKMRTGTVMDNLAVSGDYYSVPTINFHKLPYGTYKVELRAFRASAAATGAERTAYWVDGIRVYNPMGSTQNYDGTVVKEAYDLEVNAVFTEVRDILLDNRTFTENSDGAVFIDWIRDGQTAGEDQVGVGQHTYEIGTFETYGPKNEVYLSSGQAIVLRVDPQNHYFVGLKSLSGGALTVNVSGIDRADPEQITLKHSTDLYYQVTPVDGYIVIQNDPASEGILSVTRLRTTNLTKQVSDGGVLPVTQQQVLTVMRNFELLLAQPEPPAPETAPSAGELLLQKLDQLAKEIFGAVRIWLAK